MSVAVLLLSYFFFFKQKTAYEMRISDWSSDVCSSDLIACRVGRPPHRTLNIADFCGIAHDANLKASREQRVGEAPFPGRPLGDDNIVHGDGPRRANRSGKTDARLLDAPVPSPVSERPALIIAFFGPRHTPHDGQPSPRSG